MSFQWWQHPGPGRFVHTAISDLRSGSNILLRLPVHTACGLKEALRARVREHDSWRWRIVDANSLDAGTPAELAEQLHTELRCPVDGGMLASPANLAQSIPAGDIHWVDGVDADKWPVWERFLGQYQHACHSLPEDRRGLFCLPLVGRFRSSPSSDAALIVRTWERHVSRLDVLNFMDRNLVSAFPSALHRRLALAISVELAGSDAALGAALAESGTMILEEPLRILEEIAKSRNWLQENVNSLTWEDGVLDDLDGERRLNSAALALNGPLGRAAAMRRIWSGQVSVLYPFIEDQRVKIVAQVSSFIHFPVETTFGRVGCAMDLEVGQLLYFLRSTRVSQRHVRQLRFLTDLRHALAHLEPISSDKLFSSEMKELLVDPGR